MGDDNKTKLPEKLEKAVEEFSASIGKLLTAELKAQATASGDMALDNKGNVTRLTNSADPSTVMVGMAKDVLALREARVESQTREGVTRKQLEELGKGIKADDLAKDLLKDKAAVDREAQRLEGNAKIFMAKGVQEVKEGKKGMHAHLGKEELAKPEYDFGDLYKKPLVQPESKKEGEKTSSIDMSELGSESRLMVSAVQHATGASPQLAQTESGLQSVPMKTSARSLI